MEAMDAGRESRKSRSSGSLAVIQEEPKSPAHKNLKHASTAGSGTLSSKAQKDAAVNKIGGAWKKKKKKVRQNEAATKIQTAFRNRDVARIRAIYAHSRNLIKSEKGSSAPQTKNSDTYWSEARHVLEGTKNTMVGQKAISIMRVTLAETQFQAEMQVALQHHCEEQWDDILQLIDAALDPENPEAVTFLSPQLRNSIWSKAKFLASLNSDLKEEMRSLENAIDNEKENKLSAAAIDSRLEGSLRMGEQFAIEAAPMLEELKSLGWLHVPCCPSGDHEMVLSKRQSTDQVHGINVLRCTYCPRPVNTDYFYVCKQCQGDQAKICIACHVCTGDNSLETRKTHWVHAAGLKFLQKSPIEANSHLARILQKAERAIGNKDPGGRNEARTMRVDVWKKKVQKHTDAFQKRMDDFHKGSGHERTPLTGDLKMKIDPDPPGDPDPPPSTPAPPTPPPLTSPRQTSTPKHGIGRSSTMYATSQGDQNEHDDRMLKFASLHDQKEDGKRRLKVESPVDESRGGKPGASSGRVPDDFSGSPTMAYASATSLDGGSNSDRRSAHLTRSATSTLHRGHYEQNNAVTIPTGAPLLEEELQLEEPCEQPQKQVRIETEQPTTKFNGWINLASGEIVSVDAMHLPKRADTVVPNGYHMMVSVLKQRHHEHAVIPIENVLFQQARQKSLHSGRRSPRAGSPGPHRHRGEVRQVQRAGRYRLRSAGVGGWEREASPKPVHRSPSPPQFAAAPEPPLGSTKPSPLPLLPNALVTRELLVNATLPLPQRPRTAGKQRSGLGLVGASVPGMFRGTGNATEQGSRAARPQSAAECQGRMKVPKRELTHMELTHKKGNKYGDWWERK